MKFEKALNEAQIKVNPTSNGTGVLTVMQRLWAKGIKIVYIDEGIMPDVQKEVPPGYDLYGRGGFFKDNGGIYIQGGAAGSKDGHPSSVRDGFYWGVKYRENALYIVGRMRGEENTKLIQKYLGNIVIAMIRERALGEPPRQYRLPQPGQASVASKITTVNRSDLIGRKPTTPMPQRPAASTRRPVAPAPKPSGYSDWGN
jgi:hypothetical protein